MKMWMWVAGLAAGAVALGAGIAYAASKSEPAPTPQSGSAVPSTQLTPGQKYLITAMTPTGITSDAELNNALTGAGWTQISVFVGFGEYGTPPSPAYVAIATWNGKSGPAPAALTAFPLGNLTLATTLNPGNSYLLTGILPVGASGIITTPAALAALLSSSWSNIQVLFMGSGSYALTGKYTGAPGAPVINAVAFQLS